METKIKGREISVTMLTELKILNLAFRPLSDEDEDSDVSVDDEELDDDEDEDEDDKEEASDEGFGAKENE